MEDTAPRADNEEKAKDKTPVNNNALTGPLKIEDLGPVKPPKGIKACDMREDDRGSRFPHYRGYVLGVAGSNYTVVACGVGVGEHGRSFPARDITYKINDSAIMISHGFHNDVIRFNTDFQEKLDKCESTLQKQMSLLGTAGIVKALLYNRRFQTYFKCNILAGLDQHDGGCLYVFDPLGGFKREPFVAGGCSSINMRRLLARKMNLNTSRSIQVTHDKEEAADILTQVYRAAEEQRLFNGHAVVIYTITSDGTTEDFRRVRED